MSTNINEQLEKFWDKIFKNPEERERLIKLSQNAGLTALATTATIGLVKLPIEKYFLLKAQNKEFNINHQSIKSAGYYAGYRVFVQGNLPRSCYLIMSKNNNKSKEFETSEHTQEKNTNLTDWVVEPKLAKWFNIGAYAGIETLFTHYPDQKTTLAQLKIIHPNSFANHLKLFSANFGLKFLSSAVNLYCLTNIQYEAIKLVSHEKSHEPSLLQCLASGAISGAISGVTTYPIKQVINQVNAKASVQNNLLTFPKASQIIKSNIQNIFDAPIQQTLKSVGSGMFMRVLQSCFIFCTILGVEHTLGKNPADDLKNICGVK